MIDKKSQDGSKTSETPPKPLKYLKLNSKGPKCGLCGERSNSRDNDQDRVKSFRTGNWVEFLHPSCFEQRTAGSDK